MRRRLPVGSEARALYVERRELERRVEALRLLKDSMDPAKYTSELEKLVTAIALKTQRDSQPPKGARQRSEPGFDDQRTDEPNGD